MFWSWRWLISFNLSNCQGRLSSSGADEIALVRASGGLFFFFYYVTHLATGWKVCVQHSTHGFRQEYLEKWKGRRWQRLKWKKSARWEVWLKSTEQLNGRKKRGETRREIINEEISGAQASWALKWTLSKLPPPSRSCLFTPWSPWESSCLLLISSQQPAFSPFVSLNGHHWKP